MRAVAGLDLTVEKGEIVALVGESGSGKSSAALSLLGLLTEGPQPATLVGDARVLDIDMLGAATEERRDLRRRHLGAVFQDPTASLNPTMTIGKQLGEVAGSEEDARGRCSTPSASRTRRCACAATRTSSRGASASG